MRCICEFGSHCGGSGELRCGGCGGDLCVCAACCGNGAIECDGCSDCERDEIEDAEREAERWTCIGPECLNPHVIHTRDECFTAEMAEAFMGEEERTDG